MSTFVDTSALVALLDGDEARHAAAATAWRALLEHDEPLVTSNYVVVESFAVVQRRLGMEAVDALAGRLLPLVEVDWVDKERHGAALEALLTARRRGLSLVDCASFETMRRRGIARAFALDPDFAEQGFEVVPGPALA